MGCIPWSTCPADSTPRGSHRSRCLQSCTGTGPRGTLCRAHWCQGSQNRCLARNLSRRTCPSIRCMSRQRRVYKIPRWNPSTGQQGTRRMKTPLRPRPRRSTPLGTRRKTFPQLRPDSFRQCTHRTRFLQSRPGLCPAGTPRTPLTLKQKNRAEGGVFEEEVKFLTRELAEVKTSSSGHGVSLKTHPRLRTGPPSM